MTNSRRRRIAFVWGSNGPKQPDQLRFAASDAKKVGDALKHYCDFRVRVARGVSSYSVVRELDTVAADCNAEDDFLVYFSGHGVLEGGQLFLLLDRTGERLFTTAVRASWIMDALKHAQARNKILILDCCHAGAATGLKGDIDVTDIVTPGPSMLVLCASDRLERARELDSLQGSFLAHELCDIVTTTDPVSVTLLTKQLRERAERHNGLQPNLRVPIPYLIGELRNDFLLRGRATQSGTPEANSEDVYRKMSAAAASLNRVTIRLSVKQIPDLVSEALEARIARANSCIDGEMFRDLLEHHNVDEADAKRYVQVETRREVVQPFISLLGLGDLLEGPGVLAIGLERRCTTVFCVGWVDKPNLFEMTGTMSHMPSGILIGNENIFWIEDSDRPDGGYKRKRKNCPEVRFEIADHIATLTLDIDHRPLRDSVLGYSPKRLRAGLPDEVIMFAWVPARAGNEVAYRFPFDRRSVHSSVLELASNSISKSETDRPRWIQQLSLQIIPNDTMSSRSRMSSRSSVADIRGRGLEATIK